MLAMVDEAERKEYPPMQKVLLRMTFSAMLVMSPVGARET